jgi:hypothetical protein
MVTRFSMAGRAVFGRTLVDPIPMTRTTACPGMRAREGESSRAMIKAGSLPATGRVALRAVLAELPVVFVVRLVTGRAVRGRTLVDPVSMTRTTADACMRAREGEASRAVIKAGSLPAASVVALRAGLTKLPVMFIVGPVTGNAVLGSSRVLASGVTLHAANLPMPPCERVTGRVVIKAGPLPAIRRMALPAGLTKLPAVFVVRLVTGNAVLGGSTVLVSGVALHAGCLLVFPLQRIGRRAMIESGSLPALECVTLRTILPKLPTVLVVLLVARVAVLWGSAVLVPRVALHAGYLLVFASQQIGRRSMIESGAPPALECVALCAILA